MNGRQVALYFAWSRPGEISAPLETLEDRFPALFELRRTFWPHWEQFADPARFDQGIGGFLDHIQLPNFDRFAELAAGWTGNPVRRAERGSGGGTNALDARFLDGVDTLIVISFDSSRTNQRASDTEISAVRAFVDNPDHTLFVCPHHDIGDASDLPEDERLARREIEFHHHGDRAIPARQCFGDFGLSLLEGLGLQVKNRFGLRPARFADGSPTPLAIDGGMDRAGLMQGVLTFNLHAHLPHLERLGDTVQKMDVLARQQIDREAPPHPFTANGRSDFDALLQSKAGVFRGRVLVCDTTTFSSTVGGLESLERFWQNIVQLKRSGAAE